MNEHYKKIEADRFAHDPFYKLLFDINGTFKDKPNIKFIDELLKYAIRIIYKKYNKPIKANKHIPIIFELISNPNKYNGLDYNIKLFALLLMINYEPELATYIEKLYDMNGGLFEKNGPRMFRQTMLLVRENIGKTFEFPYCVANIVEIIDNFIRSIKLKYGCG